ncbi:MAG: serine--tRNA ligase, partial [Gammaproteobacteria bacterium]
MIDIKKIREDILETRGHLLKRGYVLDEKKFLSLDKARKNLQINVETLQAERKKLSSEFGKLKSTGNNTDALKKTIDNINNELDEKGNELQIILTQIDSFLLDIPNLPCESVPDGESEKDNIVVKKFGSIESKNTLDHLEITKDISTELAVKLSGSRFSVLKGDMAKLQRALISFMIDTAIS